MFFAVWVVVFLRLGGSCVPIGLVWLYDTRSVRGYSIHTLSLTIGRGPCCLLVPLTASSFKQCSICKPFPAE